MGLPAKVERSPEEILADHLDSWEAHVSAWVSRRDDLTKNQFVLGLIASSVETKYGGKSIAIFAKEVNESVDTVYLYREVYRKCYQFWNRFQNLSWSHFATVAKAEIGEAERGDLLQSAADGEWSKRQLKREMGLRKVTEELAANVPHLDPQMASAISHWRELKPMVEKFYRANPQFTLYADDFIGDVDEAMEEPWDSARAFVERLIYGGCREVEFLAQASHWRKETVERLCEELIAVGTHEWRDQGGKTDEARGARRKLIMPIEEPSGDMYGTKYGMVLDGDDDD